MMFKDLMQSGLTAAIAIAAMTLAGCGQSGGSNNNSGGSGAADALAPDGHAADTQAPAGAAVDASALSLALDDSSAEGAINTYLNRLKVGDLSGAAEICIAGAPGTDTLLTIGTNIEVMMADPEQASLAETTKALLVGDLKTAEASKVIEEDGVVVYEVKVLNKPAVNIRVEQREGAWRVIPPPDGMPFG